MNGTHRRLLYCKRSIACRDCIQNRTAVLLNGGKIIVTKYISRIEGYFCYLGDGFGEQMGYRQAKYHGGIRTASKNGLHHRYDEDIV